MKELSLRPYFGTVRVCRSKAEYLRQHKQWMGHPDDGVTPGTVGRFSMQTGRHQPKFLIWYSNLPSLAHELSHVVLEVFQMAGIDPRQAEGEPFCYMLSQLLTDLGIKEKA